MADLVFYTNPMSRGQTVRWMLEEVGAPYETEILDYGTTMKAEPYLSINPMGKVPAIRHNGKVVTESAAICAYLAESFPETGLAPGADERAAYYRWLFFAAGPLEHAVTNKAMAFAHPAERDRMFGYGNYDITVDVLDRMLSKNDYACGGRYTAADVYLGSQVMACTEFNMLPARDSFVAYGARLAAREACRRAKEIDGKLIAEMQAKQESADA